jgi:hypothetical protein
MFTGIDAVGLRNANTALSWQHVGRLKKLTFDETADSRGSRRARMQNSAVKTEWTASSFRTTEAAPRRAAEV